MPGGRAASVLSRMPDTILHTEQRPGQKPVADKEAGAVFADKTVTRGSQELGFRPEAAVGHQLPRAPRFQFPVYKRTWTE